MAQLTVSYIITIIPKLIYIPLFIIQILKFNTKSIPQLVVSATVNELNKSHRHSDSLWIQDSNYTQANEGNV